MVAGQQALRPGPSQSTARPLPGRSLPELISHCFAPGPGRLRSPWSAVICTLGQRHCNAQKFVPPELSESSLPPPHGGTRVNFHNRQPKLLRPSNSRKMGTLARNGLGCCCCCCCVCCGSCGWLRLLAAACGCLRLLAAACGWLWLVVAGCGWLWLVVAAVTAVAAD